MYKMSEFMCKHFIDDVRGGAFPTDGERRGFKKGYSIRECTEKSIVNISSRIKYYRAAAGFDPEITGYIVVYLIAEWEYSPGKFVMTFRVINGKIISSDCTPFPSRMIAGNSLNGKQ